MIGPDSRATSGSALIVIRKQSRLTTSALVSFKKRSTGYQILVGSDAEESGSPIFEEVAELLGAGHPQVMREERRCKTGVNCSPVRPEPPSPQTRSSVCLANSKSWSSS